MKLKVFSVVFVLFLSILPFQTNAAQIGIEYSQTVSAYVSSSKTASGTTPRKYITAAITPKEGTTVTPSYPFGSTLVLTTPVSLPGYGNKSTFIIEDINPRNTGETYRAIDIYFGSTSADRTNALSFGQKSKDYTVQN